MQYNNYSLAHQFIASSISPAFRYLGVFGGGGLMALCLTRRVNAAILIGILAVTFIAWIPTQSNKATYFTSSSTIPGGEDRYQVR